jgi:hypothetical protein
MLEPKISDPVVGEHPLEEKPWFTTSVYDCFLVERDILQLTI